MSQRLAESVDRAIQAPGTVEVQSPGGLSVKLDVVMSGKVGVILGRLQVKGPSGDLAQRAADAARSLRPGGASLTPIELDVGLGGATLRSPVDRQRRFYEADITRCAIELTRSKVGEGGERRPVDFSLTREGLSELLDGLEDVMLPPLDG